MAEPYFVFKGIDSRAMGVRVISYPPIVRANMRTTAIAIPGRAGELTQTEGDDIYEPYTRAMGVANAPGAQLQPVMDWLRGSGTMILGNETDFVYDVRVDAQLQMDKHFRDCWSGSLQLRCKPFKRTAQSAADLSITSSGTDILNPGDVAARPQITLTGSGAATITIGGKTLTFTNLITGTVIDLENQWIIVSGTPVCGAVSGEFGSIPTGHSEILFTGGITAITVPQDWLYV